MDSVVVVSLRFGGGGGGEVVMIWSLGGCVVTIATFGSGVSVVVSGTAVDSVVVVSLRFGGGGGGEVVMIWSLGGCVGGFDLTATFGIVAVSLETLKSV